MKAWKRHLLLMLEYRNKGLECTIEQYPLSQYHGIGYWRSNEEFIVLVKKITSKTVFLMSITGCLSYDEVIETSLKPNVTAKDFVLPDWHLKQVEKRKNTPTT